MASVHILHENEAWTAPLEVELARLGLPYELWFLDEGHLDLARPPPEGIFYNRMSASSHTRDHRYGPEYAACVQHPALVQLEPGQQAGRVLGTIAVIAGVRGGAHAIVEDALGRRTGEIQVPFVQEPQLIREA